MSGVVVSGEDGGCGGEGGGGGRGDGEGFELVCVLGVDGLLVVQ